ncbi:MAG: Fic family protein [bacterium]|nr:Fic family protein [Gammaproteobacteria bacterium]HIL97686.1 Fic family protein [Pseudomonadales bacterium]
MRSRAGYSWLKEAHDLPVIDLWQPCWIDSATKGRKKRDLGTHKIELFEASYQPEDSLTAQLQFALRYEGVNLQLLSLLLNKTGHQELCDWILQSPGSVYARRTCFLYEWLTHKEIPIESPVSSKTRYVDALDSDMQFGSTVIDRMPRFRVNNNLPGTPQFCPLVRRTGFLEEIRHKDLTKQTKLTLTRYDEDLVHRAAAFLYLKETQSSFEVEREKPSSDRAQRFADLLRHADTGHPLTEERLVELQNAVVDPRFHEFGWRSQQNWLGDDLGYQQKIDFVPPRPEDVPGLMQGLLDTAEKARANIQANDDDTATESSLDPLISAAIIAFGFVFIHPFMDGNGRIHRYLIHDVLANAGFTPRGIVLPVSAVILANLDRYVAVLENFSKPVREKTTYSPALSDVVASGNDAVYFSYFDATEQTEFLCWALLQTIEKDLHEEIDFLVGFGRAQKLLNELLDWPRHSLSLFIRVVHQNEDRLSKAKKESHFDWMTEEEIALAEARVKEAFNMADD